MTIPLHMQPCSSTSCRNGRTGFALLIGLCAVAACGRGGLKVPGPTAVGGSGGTQGEGATLGLGTGGAGPASGGVFGSGGSLGSGGSAAVGGAASGGNLGSGGMPATGGTKATGGTVATGGSSSVADGGGSCSDVAPCGGDTVGAWMVTSSCLDVSGQLDLSPIGLGCPFAQISGSLQVAGAWTGNSNGTYSDNTTTSGSEQVIVPASCLQVSGTVLNCDGMPSLLGLVLGYYPISCKSIASGGCACSASEEQAGWAGFVSSLSFSTDGAYVTSGTQITFDDKASYSYCVSGNTMTWTPQSKYPSITGTIVFHKAESGER